MLQSKIAETPVTDPQNNSAITQSKYIARPENHSEWYQVEVGTERANVMTCGASSRCNEARN